MIARLSRGVRQVRAAHRNGIRLTPMTVFNTVRLSVRATGRPWYELPIIVSGPTLVRVSRLAKIDVAPDSRLIIGSGGNRQVFDADRTRAALVMLRGSTLSVHSGQVRLSWGSKARIATKARLVLGGGSYINANCTIFAHTGVHIGARCNLAWGVTLMDTDFHLVSADSPRFGPVHIEDDVWIGAEVMVLQGSTVGAGSVVGARSVVRGTIPPRSLAVGQPARVVRTDVDWQL